MLGPPWHPAPPAYMLHGRRLAIATPSTVALAKSLLVAEKKPILGAVSVILDLSVDRGAVLELLVDPDQPATSQKLVEEVADMLVLHCTGWNRWVLERLWRASFDAWPMIGGRLLADGVDPADMPISQASAALYATWQAIHRHNPDGWKKWTDKLFRDPPRQVRRMVERANAEQAEADFAAVQAMMGTAATSPDTSSEDTPPSDKLDGR